MIQAQTYDIFISHAWRYHPDWKRVVDMLNVSGMRTWRNFSLPWYDPALDPRTEKGGKVVRWQLESQIIPVHAVLLLAGVWREPGTHKWLEYEMEMAGKHAKPVLALPAWGETALPEEIRARADIVVDWNPEAVLAAVAQARTGQVDCADVGA
jgi:hypothetical protein